MFCRNCGKELLDGWTKCPYCGMDITESMYQRASKRDAYSEEENIFTGPYTNTSGYVSGTRKRNVQYIRLRKRILLGILLIGIVWIVVTLAKNDDLDKAQKTEKTVEEDYEAEDAADEQETQSVTL